MTAIFLALAVDTWVSTALLLVGLAALILDGPLRALGSRAEALDALTPETPEPRRVGAVRNGCSRPTFNLWLTLGLPRI